MEPEIVQLEKEADKILEIIRPSNIANAVRSKATDFVRQVVSSKLKNVMVVECGSTCFRTYLADGDLDLTVLTSEVSSSADEQQHLIMIFTALCEEIYRKENPACVHNQFTIRNVDFINARTKLINCLVNNIGVDITLNQVSAVSSMLFLEKADSAIGCGHLFKQSVLLIKCWCMNESYRHCGMAILGAKEGMLSSYALSVLVLHLFNKFPTFIVHPFHALHLFFYYYCNFPWDTHTLTLCGPVPTTPGGSGKYHNFDAKKFKLCKNRFEGIMEDVRQRVRQCSRSPWASRFVPKVCNIQDPVDEMNNLGISVNQHTMVYIINATISGYNLLTSVVQRTAMFVRPGFYPFPGGKAPNGGIRNNGAHGPRKPPRQNGSVPHQDAPALAAPPPLSPMPPCSGWRSSDETDECGRVSPSSSECTSPASAALQAPLSGSPPYLNSPGQPPADIIMPPPAPLPPAPSAAAPLGPEHIMYGTAPPVPMVGYPAPYIGGLLLSDFFPVSVDKYSQMPRFDLWEHPLQQVRGMESMVYRSISQDTGCIGDVLECDVDLLGAMSFVAQSRSGPSSPRAVSAAPPAVVYAASEPGEIETKVEVETVRQPPASDEVAEAVDESYLQDRRASICSTASACSSSTQESPKEISEFAPHGDLQVENATDCLVPKAVEKACKSKKKSSSVAPPAAVVNPTPVLSISSKSKKHSKKAVADPPSKEPPSATDLPKLVQATSVELVSMPLPPLCVHGEEESGDAHERLAARLVDVLRRPVALCALSSLVLLCLYLRHLHLSPLAATTQAPVYTNHIYNTNQLHIHILDPPIPAPPLRVMVTHWVQVGESITFGDFGPPVGASAEVQPFGVLGYIPTASMANVQYLWRKDNVTVIVSSLPFFTIHRSELTDAGHYQCFRVHTNQLDSQSANESEQLVDRAENLTLVAETVIRISKKPRVRSRPSYQEVKAGRGLFLRLDVEAVPPPSFQWFRNGYPLSDQRTPELQISEATPTDSGTYSCEVRNIAGAYLWLEATVLVTD